jgi:hypothetical protein
LERLYIAQEETHILRRRVDIFNKAGKFDDAFNGWPMANQARIPAMLAAAPTASITYAQEVAKIFLRGSSTHGEYNVA